MFRCSDFTDIFARYEATACLEPARLVIGINKIAEMRLRLDMAFVVMPPDGPRFDCAVHAVNLPYVQGYAGWVSRCPMPFSVQIMSTRMGWE